MVSRLFSSREYFFSKQFDLHLSQISKTAGVLNVFRLCYYLQSMQINRLCVKSCSRYILETRYSPAAMGSAVKKEPEPALLVKLVKLVQFSIVIHHFNLLLNAYRPLRDNFEEYLTILAQEASSEHHLIVNWAKFLFILRIHL